LPEAHEPQLAQPVLEPPTVHTEDVYCPVPHVRQVVHCVALPAEVGDPAAQSLVLYLPEAHEPQLEQPVLEPLGVQTDDVYFPEPHAVQGGHCVALPTEVSDPVAQVCVL